MMNFYRLDSPVLIPEERRLCFTRVYWKRGTVGDGCGYSAKCSISLKFAPCDAWIGLYVQPEYGGWIAYLCLLPFLPIRVHVKKSFGGTF
jgi:hypothetical protein